MDRPVAQTKDAVTRVTTIRSESDRPANPLRIAPHPMTASFPDRCDARVASFRKALLPVNRNVEATRLMEALGRDGDDLLALIRKQGLAPIWHHVLQRHGLLTGLSEHIVRALAEDRHAATARYLAQRNALARVDGLFESANIRYVVIKGTALREALYDDPALRPAGDIDLLVTKHDRLRACALLREAGYRMELDPDNISHEVTFTDGIVDIDLHWDILRPGRTRTEMTLGILDRRQRIAGFWGASDEDALFLMLIHPAFTKYVSSPNLGLRMVVDFLYWIQKRSVDWPTVVVRLEQAGLKTAAWTQLRWYGQLTSTTDHPLLSSWARDLAPGHLRRAYLDFWLAQDLPERWLQRSWCIQLGFTLFLHDSLKDAMRAVAGWWRSRRHRRQVLHQLQGLLE
jgi:hypothetical protein